MGKKYLDESGEDDIDYIEVNDLKERVKLGVRKTERVETRLRLGEGQDGVGGGGGSGEC